MDPQNKSVKMSQKKLYTIVIVIVVILIIGWIVKATMMRSYYGYGGVNVDRSLGGAVTYSTDQGKVTVGSNVLPENWPSDAPKYPGAKIQYSGSSNPQTGEQGASIMFTTTDKLQQVVDFYKRELASNGWAVENTATMGASTVIAAKKGDRTFGLYIIDTGEGEVTVTVGIGMPK